MEAGRISQPTRSCRRRDEPGQHGLLAILRQSDQDQSRNRTHRLVGLSSGHEWRLTIVVSQAHGTTWRHRADQTFHTFYKTKGPGTI